MCRCQCICSGGGRAYGLDKAGHHAADGNVMWLVAPKATSSQALKTANESSSWNSSSGVSPRGSPLKFFGAYVCVYTHVVVLKRNMAVNTTVPTRPEHGRTKTNPRH